MIPTLLASVGLFLTLIGAVVAGLWGAPYPGTLITASGYPDFARKQRRMAWCLRGGLLLVALGTIQLAGSLLVLRG
jgi:xanthine/uracil/vitamin C permease (AzgA family)